MKIYKNIKEVGIFPLGSIAVCTNNEYYTVTVGQTVIKTSIEDIERSPDNWERTIFEYLTGEVYYTFDLTDGLIYEAEWRGSERDKLRFKNGFTFKTQEAAEDMYRTIKVMASSYIPNKGEVCCVYEKGGVTTLTFDPEWTPYLGYMAMGNLFPNTEQGKKDCEYYGKCIRPLFIKRAMNHEKQPKKVI